MEFVWIPALKMWVGKYEVTNGEYRKYKPAYDSGDSGKLNNGHSLNGDRQPVVNVSYDDVAAFAEWMNSEWKEENDTVVFSLWMDKTVTLPEGYKARLPDGKEWMTFAQCADGRKYPWGNEMPPKYGNYCDIAAKKAFHLSGNIDDYDDGYAVSCPVEKSGKNDWGLYGVGGNACEWTSELYDSGKDLRVVRGWSWDFYQPDYLECACRNMVGTPTTRHRYIGFRLLLSP